MSEGRALLTDMANGLFAELRGADFAACWQRIEEAGFGGLLVSEAEGGFGGDWGDLFAVMRLAGQHLLALPLGETIIAHRLLADAGLERPGGPLSFVADAGPAPWGREAAGLLRIAEGTLYIHAAGSYQLALSHSPAGEPRDRISFTGAATAQAKSDANLTELGAFLRIGQALGALDAALQLSIEHANTRVQFGKPLAKFQAVQQNLAALATETAAVSVAGQAAAAALDRGDASFEIAAAKIRTNLSIGPAVAIAHQVHGAIGFTQEYALHHFTKRLMGWRSEFGNDAFWSVRLGRRVAALGSSGFWNELTARSDRAGAA